MPKPEIAFRNPDADRLRAKLRDLPDADLVARAGEGNRTAFEVLVQRHTPMVISFLYEKTRSESDTEDLAQEVFLTAFRALSRLRDPNHFRAWLMQIARSKAIDFHRYKSRRPQFLTVVNVGDDGEEVELLDATADPSPSASERLAAGELNHAVMREIEGLKEKYREILLLRLIGDVTTQEISIRLQLGEGAVRMRLHRGLKLLRKRLEKLGISPTGEGGAR